MSPYHALNAETKMASSATISIDTVTVEVIIEVTIEVTIEVLTLCAHHRTALCW